MTRAERAISDLSPWLLMGQWGKFEYWKHNEEVYRRKASEYNYLSAVDGSPVGARYESSFAHFCHYVAGRMEV